MFYEVRATMFFSEENEAEDFFHDCQVSLPKAGVINPGYKDEQFSYFDLIQCQHDEPLHQDCHLVAHEDNEPASPSER